MYDSPANKNKEKQFSLWSGYANSSYSITNKDQQWMRREKIKHRKFQCLICMKDSSGKTR